MWMNLLGHLPTPGTTVYPKQYWLLEEEKEITIHIAHLKGAKVPQDDFFIQ